MSCSGDKPWSLEGHAIHHLRVGHPHCATRGCRSVTFPALPLRIHEYLHLDQRCGKRFLACTTRHASREQALDQTICAIHRGLNTKVRRKARLKMSANATSFRGGPYFCPSQKQKAMPLTVPSNIRVQHPPSSHKRETQGKSPKHSSR